MYYVIIARITFIHVTFVHRYQCGICNKIYREGNAIKQHLLDHTPAERLELVGKMSHILQKTDCNVIRMPLRVSKCVECNKHFVKDCFLKIHMNGVHKGDDKQYLCSHCGMRFGFVRGLTRHEATHKTEKLIACEVCGMRFKSKDSLNVHQVQHREGFKGRFACEFCGKRFNWKTGLRTHMRLHTGKLTFNLFSCCLSAICIVLPLATYF